MTATYAPATIHTFVVDGTLEDEGINPATPYEVVSSPYGETVRQSFATEAEAVAEVAAIAAYAATAPEYLTSWGMQAVNGHSSVTLFLAPAPSAAPTWEGPLQARTVRSFDAMREAGQLAPYTAYLVSEVVDGEALISVAYSPDGVGVYWYDTLTELAEQHA